MRDGLRIDPGSQQRSRAAFERIVEAAAALLDGRDWSTITVEDLCLEAEVSPSSFYRRFRSKDDLLNEVHERWLANRREGARLLAAGIAWDEMPLHEICRVIASVYLADRSEVSARSLSMFRVQVSYPRLAARRLQTDKENLEVVVSRLARRIDRGYEDTCFAILVISSAVLSAVQPPAPFAQLFGWDTDELVERFVSAFGSMLRLDLSVDAAERGGTVPVSASTTVGV